MSKQPTPPTRTQLLIEARLGEQLAPFVSRHRPGMSWHKLALKLNSLTEVPVTGESLRLWFGHREQPARRAS